MEVLYIEFEWDEYNSGKNLHKHGVSDTEIARQVWSLGNGKSTK